MDSVAISFILLSATTTVLLPFCHCLKMESGVVDFHLEYEQIEVWKMLTSQDICCITLPVE